MMVISSSIRFCRRVKSIFRNVCGGCIPQENWGEGGCPSKTYQFYPFVNIVMVILVNFIDFSPFFYLFFSDWLFFWTVATCFQQKPAKMDQDECQRLTCHWTGIIGRYLTQVYEQMNGSIKHIFTQTLTLTPTMSIPTTYLCFPCLKQRTR